MSRIKRSATYFKDPQNQNFWCRPCYNQLKKADKILLDDGTEINKSELLYAKLDTLPEEPFVKCPDCDGRFHKVCALANSRKIRSKSPFRCPKCVLVRRSVDKESQEIKNPESAKKSTSMQDERLHRSWFANKLRRSVFESSTCRRKNSDRY
mmetsp:Transcript_27294/g.65398  ORF Transcript_27294/g.65398 Transcript_27294/m.65398 type:complete len:152 (-) Transcript_27294:3160-3615(-)